MDSDASETAEAQKGLLRGELREVLKRMPAALRHVKSTKIRTNLVHHIQTSPEIALFASTAWEPDLDPLWTGGILDRKLVFYPKLTAGEIKWAPVSGLHELHPGPMGFREPMTPVESYFPALILVPGLAYSRAGDRLGRGGGFYDRLLGQITQRCLKVGVCFEEQIRTKIPTSPHDIAVDEVISA